MKFVDIDSTNAAFVDSIYPGDVAQYWVHYNWYWRENSQKKSDIACKLIYVEEHPTPIGIIAYGQYYQDEELTQAVPGWYEIIHMVIDQPHQRHGYGKQATLLAIELLRRNPDCRAIVIAHNPQNIPARRLYESLGFVEFGRNYDDDPLLKLAGIEDRE